MFNTFHNRRLHDWEHAGDLDFAYGVARAHNRGMIEFCTADSRLLPTCYVPLVDFDRAAAMAGEAIQAGAAALLVASGCPAEHSPSHIALDRVWAQTQEAGLPVVFHVGGTGDLIPPGYFRNGLPVPPDFHGGEENFRSVDYMAIPHPPMQTLATMIFDGVLERFPDLRIGVIEQGAVWVPSWLRQMESAVEAFARHEERLRALTLRPSEYVRRQVRATPYPTEDVGWIIRETGPEVCMFSSDYPHVEGGRRPIERFEASLGKASEAVRRSFYCDNFLDLMGAAGAGFWPLGEPGRQGGAARGTRPHPILVSNTSIRCKKDQNEHRAGSYPWEVACGARVSRPEQPGTAFPGAIPGDRRAGQPEKRPLANRTHVR